MDRVRIIVNEISNYKREGRLNVSLINIKKYIH